MTKTKNASKYSDSRWQKKRLEVMNRDGFKCKSCGAEGEGVMLNVHHAYYRKGAELWEYNARSLVTLCEACHERRHTMQEELLILICQRTNEEVFGLTHIAGEYPELFKEFFYMSKHGVCVSGESLCMMLRAMRSAFHDGRLEEISSPSTEISHE